MLSDKTCVECRFVRGVFDGKQLNCVRFKVCTVFTVAVVCGVEAASAAIFMVC